MGISLSVSCSFPDHAQAARFTAILARHVQARSGTQVHVSAAGPASLSVVVDNTFGRDGFKIESGQHDGAIITGKDFIGILHGLGKYLRTSTYGNGTFIPSSWRGTSNPDKPLRAVYLATHFFNFYHAAPVEEIQEYIEDLALWGFNAIFAWYDMHHFSGIGDPEAVMFIDRLRCILMHAKSVGLQAGLTLLANEAYANSPRELRADQSFLGTRHVRGGYGVELCPSNPQAKDLMLKWFWEEFKAFSGVALDFLMIWPYDQGGCCCPGCSPWGANGFVSMAEAIARACRQHVPGVKVILSTWLFDPNGIDEGEWKGLATRFAVHPAWVDFILADSHGDYPRFPLDSGVPGKLPLLNFPEISMHGMNPWGGFGANPLPARFQRSWDAVGDRLAGGILYSEGIYEDLNKAIWSQFYWDGRKTARDTVREYVAHEFPGCDVDAIADAIAMLEQNHRRFSTRRRSWLSRDDAGARAALAAFQRANDMLPRHVKASWRWRVLFLRSTLDFERFNGERYPNKAARRAFEELTAMYHAEGAEPCVRPPFIGKKSRK